MWVPPLAYLRVYSLSTFACACASVPDLPTKCRKQRCKRFQMSKDLTVAAALKMPRDAMQCIAMANEIR